MTKAERSTLVMVAAGESEYRQSSYIVTFLRRLVRNRSAIIGGVGLALILISVILGPVLYKVDPDQQDLQNVLLAPNRQHPLGTDSLGRDLLARVMYGGRISLFLGIVLVTFALTAGTAIGASSGFIGGIVDEIIMRIIDILMAFPGFLLALLMIAILGPGLREGMIAIGVAYVPRFARLARASTLAVKEMDYIEAAYSIGQRRPMILLKHITPNIVGPLIVQATVMVGQAILVAASLGFLGLGVQPPTPEWGTMVSQARDYVRLAPHSVMVPGTAIFISVLSFNLMGDGLRDALDVSLDL